MPAPAQRSRAIAFSPWLTNPAGQILHTLTSVRFALILILLISLGVLAGTLINQVPGAVAADPPSYERWLDSARERYGPFTTPMERAQLFQVFSSVWFRGLIVVLVASIIVCTANRWSGIKAAVFTPRVRMNAAYFDRAKMRAAFSVSLDEAAAAGAVRRGLRSAGYRALEDKGESVALYADRFRWSRLGTFLTHLSLVLILVGAVMGRVWGWKDNQFIVPQGATRELPLAGDISVKLEQFQEEWYVEGPPKDFSSDLVIYEDGREVKRGTTRVNAPLTYKGISFNQAFFGQVAVMEVRDATGAVIFNDGVPLAWTARDANRPIGFLELPGQQVRGYVVGPEPGSYDAAIPLGTMRLELYDAASGQLLGIESLARNQTVVAEGLSFRFLRESQFTGLKVVKDPGVNVIWIASALMVLGLVMVFWFPHRRLWALCTPRDDGGTDVRLAAASQRDLGMEKDFEQVTAKVRWALTHRQHDEKGGGGHV
jgi:cytochrome c biogenesis protein